MGLGVYTPQLLSVMLPLAVCLLLLLAAAVIAGGALRTAAGLLLGALLQVSATSSALEQRLPVTSDGDSLLVRCSVLGVPRVREISVAFDAVCDGSFRLPGRVRLTWFQPLTSVQNGDHWQWVVQFRQPRGAANPGRSDAGHRALTVGIDASGYVVASSRNRLLGAQRNWLTELRQDIRTRILMALPGRASAGVVVALATGIRDDISDTQWQRFEASGTNHLVAISGLHVGLVAGFALLLSRPIIALARPRDSARRLSLLPGFVAAVVFAMLSGWGVPAQRACLMLLVVVIAATARREVSGFHALATAGSIVLLSDPLASMSAGFTLSFAAVAVLLWLFLPLAVPPGAAPKRFSAPRTLLAMQIGLFFGLLPVLAVAGQGASAVAPIVNLVAVPLFSVVTVPATLIGVLLMPFGGEALGFQIAALSVDTFEAFVDRAVILPPISVPGLLSLPALAIVLLPAGFAGRAVAGVALTAMLLAGGGRVPGGCFDAHFLDVGQGSAILVETSGHRLLYDTGPAYRLGRSAAEALILPFARQHDIRQIDTLVVSHADLDHAGGLHDVLRHLSPSRIYAGEWLTGVPMLPCHARQAWVHDGIRFQFLYPQRPLLREGNDASCVLEVSAGDHRLLLTGDIERQAERDLVRDGLREVDIVSMPHHGSRTSSTAPFIQHLNARYVVVSAAAKNRWGLPLPEVVQRWEAVGSRVIHLGVSGYTRFRVCRASGVSLDHVHREQQRRWWQRPQTP